MSDPKPSISIYAVQSAAAIMSGMFSVTDIEAIAAAWHSGVTELYYEIGEYGILSETLSRQHENKVGMGVYAYDTDEPFGIFLANEILAGTYEREKAKQKLKELVDQFFIN